MNIRLNETQFKKYIKNLIEATLYEKDLIIEMAKINRKDTGAVPFPFNKFDIVVYPDDHNPPHFHVICEDWNLRFLIENGEQYREDTSMGSSSKIYSYIMKNIKDWLHMQCRLDKTKTNQEYMKELWDYYHIYEL